MTSVDICNNALDLIGQGLHITSLSDNSKEAESCQRLYDPTLKRCLEKFDWSFCRKTFEVTAQVNATSKPFRYAYALPEDCIRVLFIQPDGGNLGIDTYDQDLRFDYRTEDDDKLLITSVTAPFYLQYQAYVTDLNLLPTAFIEWLEYCLAARLAADIIKGTEAIQISQALDTRADALLKTMQERDPKPELPVDELTADILALSGQGFYNTSLEVQRKAVGYTSRKFKETLSRIIEQHPWSFSRKSQQVTGTGTGSDLYGSSYALPDDALKVLYLVPNNAHEYTSDNLFDFRVTDEKRLVTSLSTPFTIIYQARIEDYDLIKSSIMEAVKLYVASDLILNFFKQRQTQQESKTDGLSTNDAQLLKEKADGIIDKTWAEDEPLRLPFDDRTNRVCDLIGASIQLKPLEDQKRFADFVARYWPTAMEQALQMHNWSFATRDEFITEDYLMPKIVSLPWHYTYKLPEDVMRVLYLARENSCSWTETVGYPDYIRFNFRNYMGAVYLVTDEKPNFIMRYQAKIDDKTLLPPMLVQAINYMCAAQIVTSFNTDQPAQARNNSDYFMQMGMAYIERAAGRDAQQGGYSMKQKVPSKFTRARF